MIKIVYANRAKAWSTRQCVGLPSEGSRGSIPRAAKLDGEVWSEFEKVQTLPEADFLDGYPDQMVLLL